ncbi:DUF1272 domain-containing protein [bacterium]|nr:DUF1272 domain-containing protein [bacterium]
MLEMRSHCQACGKELAPDSPNAVICSYECTFCREHELSACPNCKGELVRRPIRVLPAPTVAAGPSGPPGIEMTLTGYVLRREDGSQATLADLVSVEILNEDEVYFVLTGAQSSLVIPQSTPGIEGLLTHLQKLPGFQHDKFLEAMEGSGRFVCWRLPNEAKVGSPPEA